MLLLLAYWSIASSQNSMILPKYWSSLLHLQAKLSIFRAKLGYEFQVSWITESVGYNLEIVLHYSSALQISFSLRKSQQIRKRLPTSPSTTLGELHMKVSYLSSHWLSHSGSKAWTMNCNQPCPLSLAKIYWIILFIPSYCCQYHHRIQ